MANLSSTLQWLLSFCICISLPFTNSLGAQEVYELYLYGGEAKPIGGAEVDLTPCGLGVQRTIADGTLRFTLPSGTGCYVTIRKFGLQEVVASIAPSLPRQISIAMTPDRSADFVGSLREEGAAPLSGAVVYARSLTSNHWTKTTTNIKGQYGLKLQPRQEYVLTYAQAGFADEQLSIRTGRDNPQSTQLPAVSLRPGSSKTIAWLTGNPGGVPDFVDIPALRPGDANGYTVQIASGPTNFTEVSMKFGALTSYGRLYTIEEGGRYKLRLGIYATRQEAQGVVNRIAPDFAGAFATTEPNVTAEMFVQAGQVARENPVTNRNAAAPVQYSTPTAPVWKPERSTSAKGTVRQRSAAGKADIRYAVQVGSFSTEGPIAMNTFARLDGLGDIYSKVENGALKVRVGLWASYEQAQAARRSAAARGFSDATIVTERADDPALQAYQGAASTTTQENDDPRPVVYSNSTPTAKSGARPYYIRIAALSNPERFNPQPYQSLGDIEMRRLENGMTLVLLGRFGTLKAAEAARAKLRKQGYNEPYVVKEEGEGKLKRM